MFIWDIKNVKKIGKYRSSLAHSACIWDVDICPDADMVENDPIGQAFPAGTFVTCSADNTVRFWNLDGATPSDGQRNVFSKELVRTIYAGEDFSSMKAKDFNSEQLRIFISPSSDEVIESPSSTSDGGIRCVRFNFTKKQYLYVTE
jgi:WD40 repeat protein